jgi:DNA polymerase III subunit alpha
MANHFAHLHLHSDYSLLDGGNAVDELCKRVKALGMDAVAVTDHGNLFGAVQFYNAAKDAGIKPILGIEAYVAPKSRTFKETTGVADGGFHLVMLAENNQGWSNLLKLSSDAFINGFYYKPRMDKETITKWADGIIAINGHLGSSLAHILLRYQATKDAKVWQEAIDEARWHEATFKPNEKGEPRFFLELQKHAIPEQEALNEYILKLAKETGIPVVCDNDSHYLMEDDWDAHDTLCCISTGKLKSDTARLHYSKDLYVKSADQMSELFKEVPEAVENSKKIADRCNVTLNFKANHAPVVKLLREPSKPRKPRPELAGMDPRWIIDSQEPVGSTEWFKTYCAQFKLLPFDSVNDKDISTATLKEQCDAALKDLAEAGAVWRYGLEGITEDHRARLNRELKVLSDKNISAYFLIVWDFVNEARRRNIPAIARGSGVGTMAGYVLGLSNACPVKYGLLFERFTDPDRSEYPDIDIDICQDGRQEIIEYVKQKYGHVAQIITFGTLKARACIRDVGRVLGMPLPDVDKLCKLVGEGLDTTLEKALAQEPDLKKLYNEDMLVKKVLDTGLRLEGLSRHAGVHAAGVVVATRPLDDIVPLYRPANTDMIVTQWEGPIVEKVGLLKMDFLGLRTLSIVERAKKIIRETLKPDVIKKTVHDSRQAQGLAITDADVLDLDRLTFDDPKVLELFKRGETAGVFQFESGGMRNLLLSMKPDRLEDLIAANALYRPGPMDLIPSYCDRKHKREPVPSVHAVVDKYTSETYGIMVYQEQVMQVVHGLGGIPLRAAYTLIKNISKKKQKDIDAVRPLFVEGASKQGLTKEQAGELFELILKFAGYGFNKSHSTGYAIVAYQTGYLKTYFPAQYMAAVLTFEAVDIKKVTEYREECRNVLRPGSTAKAPVRGVEVRPPDINLSDSNFTVVFDKGESRDPDRGHIRFGLTAVKGVGEKAVQAIMDVRAKTGPFKSIFDFCERAPMGAVNKSTIEALVKCGAFDAIHGRDARAAVVEVLESAIQNGQRLAADRESGQMNFFEALAAAPAAAATPAPAAQLPKTKPWTNAEALDLEKAVLGFYASSHPLDDHKATLDRYATISVADVHRLEAGVEVTVGGMLTRVRTTITKSGKNPGQKMAMLTIEDKSGSIDGVIFSKAYAIAAPVLEEGKIVFLKAKVDKSRETPNIFVEEVTPIEQADAKLARAIRVKIDNVGETPDLVGLKQLFKTAQARGGEGLGVILEVRQDGKVVSLRLNDIRVMAHVGLAQNVGQLLGRPNCAELVGAEKIPVSKKLVPIQAAPVPKPAEMLLDGADAA